jgi:hemerythrin-like metal-binding protein
MHSHSPGLPIGVPSIDREHHDLVVRLERLINHDDVTPNSARFSEVFSELGRLLAAHFRNEENLFKSCGMPLDDIEAHIDAHHAILEQYVQMNDDLMQGKERPMMEIAAMIKNWVIGHLLAHDVKIREYVSA